jgi:hypothetical protein
LPNFGTVGF